MTMGVFDFQAINRKLNCQEQKADFEEKNPKPDLGMYGWPYGVAVPFVGVDGSCAAGRLTGGSCESVTLTAAQLPPYTPKQANG